MLWKKSRAPVRLVRWAWSKMILRRRYRSLSWFFVKSTATWKEGVSGRARSMSETHALTTFGAWALFCRPRKSSCMA